uniref:Uncharacterized protein n=1 Tax=Arundo donax TaxID=35708 RepID=A0A0A9G4D7_ARUDO
MMKCVSCKLNQQTKYSRFCMNPSSNEVTYLWKNWVTQACNLMSIPLA